MATIVKKKLTKKTTISREKYVDWQLSLYGRPSPQWVAIDTKQAKEVVDEVMALNGLEVEREVESAE